MSSTVVLAISVTPDGQMSVQHSLPNIVTAYGFLEAAKDALRSQAQQAQAKPQLFVAPPGTKVAEPPSNGHKPRITPS